MRSGPNPTLIETGSGELNPADMGMRPTVLPPDMGSRTQYQRGKDWIRMPVKDWPVRKDFMTPPLEECHRYPSRNLHSHPGGEEELPSKVNLQSKAGTCVWVRIPCRSQIPKRATVDTIGYIPNKEHTRSLVSWIPCSCQQVSASRKRVFDRRGPKGSQASGNRRPDDR